MTNQGYFLLITSFNLGFLGSLHCIGMCGGLICALCHANGASKANTNAIRLQLGYHFGRVVIYSFFGAIAGYLGVSLAVLVGVKFSLYVRLVTGILIVLSGLTIAGFMSPVMNFERLGLWVWAPAKKIFRLLFPVTSCGRAVSVGALSGFIPCGLIYTALINSMAFENAILGAASMMIFALSTLPGLLIFGLFVNYSRSLINRRLIYQASGLLIITFGFISMLIPLWKLLTSGQAGSCH